LILARRQGAAIHWQPFDFIRIIDLLERGADTAGLATGFLVASFAVFPRTGKRSVDGGWLLLRLFRLNLLTSSCTTRINTSKVDRKAGDK
jgi:hypothetical protein